MSVAAGRNALSVLKTLQEVYVPHLSGLTWEDEPVTPPTPLPWFPDNLGINPPLFTEFDYSF